MAQVVLQPGTLVGGAFRVDAVIGRGTYGVVYRATDPGGGAIALKVLGFDPDVYTDGAEVFDARVEREIKALRRLNSSSVVRLHDWGMHDDAFYLAMEFVEGRTLAQVIADSGRLPAQRAVALGQAILAGLADAHQVGIVHRDLKPDNIMVIERHGRDDEIRILDFGIARLQARSGNTFETKDGARIFGTPAYMAPEQGLGEVLPLSDQYAVGTMMFEMLAGRLPFDDPQPLQIMLAKLQQPVPALLETLGVASELVAVVHRALARRPNDRYVDALSMHRALSNVRLEVPASTPPAACAARLTPPVADPALPFAPTEAHPTIAGPTANRAAWLDDLRAAALRSGARAASLLRDQRTRRLAGAAALLLCAAALLFSARAPTDDAAARPRVVPDGSHGGQVRDPLSVLEPQTPADPLEAIARSTLRHR